MGKDIVEELREFSLDHATFADVHGLLERAAKEIEHLRSVAGAISQGQTFAQIPRGRIVYASGMATLKAFDGA